MSEELTKDQLNLVKVLNYCLETKHDFAGARSNKNTKHYAKEIIDCVNLPPILDKTSDNFESNIMTEFGLDIDSIQRDNYMESQMVQSVFLNPKTYNPKISLEENLKFLPIITQSSILMMKIYLVHLQKIYIIVKL